MQGDSRIHLTCSIVDSLAAVKSSSTILVYNNLYSLINFVAFYVSNLCSGSAIASEVQPRHSYC